MRRSVPAEGVMVALESRCLACGAEAGEATCGLCAALSLAEARVDPQFAASLRVGPVERGPEGEFYLEIRDGMAAEVGQ